MSSLLSRVVKNKVVLYMTTRYVTYALQFVTSMIIAFKLGPDLFGVWSFLLMLINFFNIFDLGISNSLNVLLVQDRDNPALANTHTKSALFITGLLCLLVAVIYGMVSLVHPAIIAKYDAQQYLICVFLVVVMAYFNKMFAAIYRVNNRLLEISIFQSAIPVALFVAIVVFKADVWYLIIAYLIGCLIALSIFLANRKITFSGAFDRKDVPVVAGKGFWLFLYNSAFYFILYTSSFLVSVYYPRMEYGKYNFAYTISHAVILLIDAFGYIIFPKMIMKLKEQDKTVSEKAIDRIRGDYISLVYLLIFLAVPVISIVTQFVPKYSDTGKVISLAAITLLPYANCFGINTFLIAQNKEKILSYISMGCLVFNIAVTFVCINVFDIPYEFVYMPIMVSYILYTLFCSLVVLHYLDKDTRFFRVLLYAFPLETILPFVAYLMLIVTNHFSQGWTFIPLALYALCNNKGLLRMWNSIKTIVYKPDIVDI